MQRSEGKLNWMVKQISVQKNHDDKVSDIIVEGMRDWQLHAASCSNKVDIHSQIYGQIINYLQLWNDSTTLDTLKDDSLCLTPLFSGRNMSGALSPILKTENDLVLILLE